jgi:aerobic carbon-monoxide dehydrogenase medium subunit
MIAGADAYEAPSTLDEACELASQAGAVLLAGGQSLLTELKRAAPSPRVIVDLRRIESLRASGDDGSGAMVTLDELAADPRVAAAPSALTDALEAIHDPQVRNRATIGGSVALVHQGADLPAVALALGTVLTISGPAGPRVVEAADFVTAPAEGRLEPGEIVTAVRIPMPSPGSGSAYEKLANPASGYAICGVAAFVAVSDGGKLEAATLGLAGAGPTALSLTATARDLTGRQATDEEVADAAASAADGLEPPSDLAAPADYRAHLIRVLTARALRRAIRRATEGAR